VTEPDGVAFVFTAAVRRAKHGATAWAGTATSGSSLGSSGRVRIPALERRSALAPKNGGFLEVPTQLAPATGSFHLTGGSFRMGTDSAEMVELLKKYPKLPAELLAAEAPASGFESRLSHFVAPTEGRSLDPRDVPLPHSMRRVPS
jgi:hypothetical protein